MQLPLVYYDELTTSSRTKQNIKSIAGKLWSSYLHARQVLIFIDILIHNVVKPLPVLLTISITSVEREHSTSSLHFLKMYLRSSMDEAWFNGLSILLIHAWRHPIAKFTLLWTNLHIDIQAHCNYSIPFWLNN